MSLEQTFSPQWINILRALHRIAKTRHVECNKLIRLSVLVDGDGNPVIWSEPDCTIVSPRGDQAKAWLNQL